MSDTPSTTEAIGQLTQAFHLLEAVRPAMDGADASLLEGVIDAVLVLHDTLAARKDVECLQQIAAQHESLEQIHESFDRLLDDAERMYRQRQYDLHIRRG